MRVTPLTIILLIVLSGAIGPLTELADMPDGALTSTDWWVRIGEQAVRGLATGALSAVAVVASAYGIEIRGRTRSAAPAQQADGDGQRPA
ncbi:MAG: hypothetical protein KatS3mg051_2149 [Anaerolineae bacterium]|nr:MAG: hypothetical protein KatS3mg051_1820 [Anaerolineae bacterium]GIV82795.1 MAG: hypothetical protein KatS3mg051_2149 [Anaerolineae bacterium]